MTRASPMIVIAALSVALSGCAAAPIAQMVASKLLAPSAPCPPNAKGTAVQGCDQGLLGPAFASPYGSGYGNSYGNPYGGQNGVSNGVSNGGVYGQPYGSPYRGTGQTMSSASMPASYR